MTTEQIAKRYHDAGYCVLPVRPDGSRATPIRWRQYTWDDLQRWFKGSTPSAIGLLCGYRSGDLEVLDFDNPKAVSEWLPMITPSLVQRLLIVATPSGGAHIYYRCPTLERNLVLARLTADDVYIETRGEGGMVVASGSPLGAHKTHKPYRVMQGDVFNPPKITEEDRALMFQVARSLNRYVAPPKPPITRIPRKAIRRGLVGDRFNEEAPWDDILVPMGWERESESGNVVYWRKPNSLRGSHHATTGYGSKEDVFYCFSTNAPPFEAGESYNKFACFTLLNFQGDYKASAQALQVRFTNDREQNKKEGRRPVLS